MNSQIHYYAWLFLWRIHTVISQKNVQQIRFSLFTRGPVTDNLTMCENQYRIKPGSNLMKVQDSRLSE